MKLSRILCYGLLIASSKAMASACFPLNICIPDFVEPDYNALRGRNRHHEPHSESQEQVNEPHSRMSLSSSVTSDVSLRDLWEDGDPLEQFCFSSEEIEEDTLPKKIRWTKETKKSDGASKPLRRIKKSSVNKGYIKARIDMQIYDIILKRVGRNIAPLIFKQKTSSQILATLFVRGVISKKEMYHIIELNVDMEASPYW